MKALSAADRDPRIDLTRGFAMVLVVLGHALIGVGFDAGGGRFGQFLLVLIYTSHMPVFFVISGYLCGRAFNQTPDKSGASLVRRLTMRILWPYCLWSLIILAAHFGMSEHTNTQVVRFEPWTILWKPPSVMWFLYVLFFAQVLFFLTAMQARPWRLALSVLFLIAPYFAPHEFLNARFIGLFILAALLPDELRRLSLNKLQILVTFLVVTASGAFIWNETDEPLTGYPAGSLEFLPMLFVGPLLIFWGAGHVRFSWTGRILELVGRNSMAIFVTHIFFTAGTRIVLTSFGLEHFALLVAICTMFGILGPLVLAKIARASGASKLMGWT